MVYCSWSDFEHVSCLGEPSSDCIVTASSDGCDEYPENVWALEFDGTRSILDQHNASGCDYFGQAQATADSFGSYAFVTHHGDCNNTRSGLVQP